MIRMIIAGGRKRRIGQRGYEQLDRLPRPFVVLSGMAEGVDLDGCEWAKWRGIDVEEYPADWRLHGWPTAGFIRNSEMARRATAVALFPGGSGTAHMARCAVVQGLTIYDWRRGVDDQRTLFNG